MRNGKVPLLILSEDLPKLKCSSLMKLDFCSLFQTPTGLTTQGWEGVLDASLPPQMYTLSFHSVSRSQADSTILYKKLVSQFYF